MSSKSAEIAALKTRKVDIETGHNYHLLRRSCLISGKIDRLNSIATSAPLELPPSCPNGSGPSESSAMRLPRPRFTLRRMMILVAVVGILIAFGIEGERRRAIFRKSANHHLWNAWGEGARPGTPDKFHRWSVGMFRKYDFAVRYPWLPVEPDPPEPK